MFDILIKNGIIVDGAGMPATPGDVGVEGERIAAIGHLAEAHAKVEIDAAGKIVCPGFVDIHNHSDWSIVANREATSSIYQGVTTEIGGNCGNGNAPITACNWDVMVKSMTSRIPGVALSWRSCSEFLDRIEEGVGLNIGYQVAHGTLRRAVMGEEARPPTEDEMRQMERLVAEALDAGAIGLSFGLEFIPGRLADKEELRRLCVIAAARGKMTSWHVRNRDRRFVEAVDEAISATRAAGAGLQLSHLSAKPGSSPRAWNRCMEAVRLARAQGHDVQCDMIPYTIGPGGMSTILPDWARKGSIEEVQARLRDPQTRERLKAESDRYWFLFYYREWDKLTLSSNLSHPEWIGMTLREIGQATGRDPFDVVYDILADEGIGIDGVAVNGVLFSEGDIIEWLSDPLFSIASDAVTSKDSGPLSVVMVHPNCFGWTPTVIQKYVRELRTFSLEEAIRKMTSLPASRFGLFNRGLLRAGMQADVLVFDQAKFKTRATFLKPQVYAEGMDYVIINGKFALKQGIPTGAMIGRVLGR